MIENVIEWLCGDETASVTFSQAKYKNRIKKLKEQNDAIRIFENQDGSIYATIPLEYIKIAKPKTKEMSDEDKQELVERLRAGRESRSDAEETEDDDE